MQFALADPNSPPCAAAKSGDAGAADCGGEKEPVPARSRKPQDEADPNDFIGAAQAGKVVLNVPSRLAPLRLLCAC